VSGGKVETYPGTLDEYMESSRKRRDGEVEAPKGERALSHGTGAKGQAVATKPAVATAAPLGKGKQDRRREAEARNERNRALAPLRKRVAEMEARIASLEADQKQRSAALADPETYADDAKRRELLAAYQRDADKLEELTGRWEIAGAELEAAEAAE
jgi:ATP-binding cassette subfamily F protein 3